MFEVLYIWLVVSKLAGYRVFRQHGQVIKRDVEAGWCGRHSSGILVGISRVVSKKHVTVLYRPRFRTITIHYYLAHHRTYSSNWLGHFSTRWTRRRDGAALGTHQVPHRLPTMQGAESQVR